MLIHSVAELPEPLNNVRYILCPNADRTLPQALDKSLRLICFLTLASAENLTKSKDKWAWVTVDFEGYKFLTMKLERLAS